MAGGSLLAAAAAGFLALTFYPNPNQQLIDDLPVLEKLDEYQQIDDISFLRAMYEQGVFADEEEGR
jgi:hypothetical protein